MAGDLPPGKYTAALVGAWWPQPSTTLKAGAAHWRTQQLQQEQYAQELHNQWTLLASQNQGHTADDLISRFQQGEKHHLDLAEKFQIKANALEKGADTIDGLRAGLRGIADDYNQRIANIENSKEPAPVKAVEIAKVVAEANGFSAHKSGAAVASIMDATQKVLTIEGVAMSPQEFLKSQGLSTEGPANATGPGSVAGHAPGGAGGHIGNAGAQVAGDGTVGSQPVGSTGHIGGTGGDSGGAQPIGSTGHISGAGAHAPGAGIVGDSSTNMPLPSTGHIPGAPGVGSPLPAGGGLSPAAALGGASPNQLANSFAQGMMTGQPAAAGAHNLSEGLMNATGATSAPPPQPPIVPPVSAPAITGGVESAPADHGSGAAASAGSAVPVASTGGASMPIAAPVAAAPASAPMTPVASPAGPLPAYGSDLRPPAVAAPAASAPTAPVSGAPVAPASSTSPSAGSPLMSTVQRSSPGQATTTPAAPAGTAALSATAGAVAGDVSSRTVEQQRLQRIVDAVARQAPELSWAAGLRDDGTTLLACGIGCGWIPPNVKIPVGVNRLLEPAVRRTDASPLDLLGAVTAAAVHKPHGFIANPGPDDPPLTGDRVARTGPEVEELGPTLVEAVRRRDGLPRIAQTLALAATRGTGVTENEIDLLQAAKRSSHQKVLEDPHDPSRVVDWMLLAAIDALLQGHEWLAQYHVAWYEAASAGLR